MFQGISQQMLSLPTVERESLKQDLNFLIMKIHIKIIEEVNE